MKNHSGISRIYHNWVEPIARHPIYSSMLLASALLPLESSVIANAAEPKHKTVIISNDPHRSAYGATFVTDINSLYKGETGTAPVIAALKTSVDTLGVKYKVVKDPRQYLERVIANPEIDEATKWNAKRILNPNEYNIVTDSMSIANLQAAVNDGSYSGEEIVNVKPGLYVTNPMSEDWRYKQNGASMIEYIEVKDGKCPDHNAGSMLSSLRDTKKTELQRMLTEKVTGSDSTKKAAAGLAGAVKDEKSWMSNNWYWAVPVGMVVAGGIGYWIASGHEEETGVNGGEGTGPAWGHE